MLNLRIEKKYPSNSSWPEKLIDGFIFQLLLTSSEKGSETQTLGAHIQGSQD